MARTILINDGGNVHQFFIGGTSTQNTPALTVELNQVRQPLTVETRENVAPVITVEPGQEVICRTIIGRPTNAIPSILQNGIQASGSNTTRLVSRFRKNGNGYEPIPLPKDDSEVLILNTPARNTTVKKWPPTVRIVDSKFVECHIAEAALALLSLNKGSQDANYNDKGCEDNSQPVVSRNESCFSPTRPLSPQPTSEVQFLREVKAKKPSKKLAAKNAILSVGKQLKQTNILRKILRSCSAKRVSQSRAQSPTNGICGLAPKVVNGDIQRGIHTTLTGSNNGQCDTRMMEIQNNHRNVCPDQRPPVIFYGCQEITAKDSIHYKVLRALSRLSPKTSTLCKRSNRPWYATDNQGKVMHSYIDQHLDKCRHTPKYTHLELLETSRQIIHDTKEMMDRMRIQQATLPNDDRKRATLVLLEATDSEVRTCLLRHQQAQGPLGQDMCINALRHIVVKMTAFQKLMQGQVISPQLAGYTKDLLDHQFRLACKQPDSTTGQTPSKEFANASTQTD